MQDRNFTTENYRFGFNGKEKDDEVKPDGKGNQQDYGMRIYDTRLGKFLSVDPLTKSYPMLTPYQFASNRPIDGIDRDGLEYATFTIYVHNGLVTKINTVTDYELKDPKTKGPGVQSIFLHVNDKNEVIKTETPPMVTNMYGIYQGSHNPKLPVVGKDYKNEEWDYRLAPIDELDALAKQHDLDYDKLYPQQAGFSGVINLSTTAANLKAAAGADLLIARGFLEELIKYQVR